jgi:hypothetical protein
MRGAKLAAAALLLPGAAGAQDATRPDTFCPDLQRVLEAAEYDHGFSMLERARGAPPRLGFPGGCQATGDERQQYWVCGQSLAPAWLSGETLSARIAACRPDAVRTESRMTRETIFTVPHAQIRVFEHGGPRAHVGRIVELVVEATPSGEA